MTSEHPPLIQPLMKFPEGDWKPPVTMLSAARLFNCSSLYLLADYSTLNFRVELRETKEAFMLDMQTQALANSNLPNGENGCILSAYDKIYHIAAPEFPSSFSVFEQFDVDTKSWIRLPDCPVGNSSTFQGFAVVEGVILVSLYCTTDFVLGYNIRLAHWFKVPICPSPSYPFLVPRSFCGRAVTIGHTLYALSENSREVLAYTFTIIGGQRCFLGSPFSCYVRAFPVVTLDQQLVHLGNLDFCLIQRFHDCGLQKFGITTFQIRLKGGMHIRREYRSVFDAGQMEPLRMRLSFRQ